MADTPVPAAEEAGGKASSKDFMATARKRFQVAIDATEDNRKDALDDVKFAAANPDNQWQWPEEVLNKRQNKPGQAPRPTLTINKLPQHIRLVTNEQRQNRPSIKVIPVDDKSDPEVAEILNGIVRHIEANSDADVAYDTAGECQVTSGEGYWRILTDYIDEMSFDQDVLIAPIRNPFSVYLDPDGLRRDSTGRYCEWGFITDELSSDEFERQFPDAKKIDWTLQGMGDDERKWFEGKRVKIAEYFCIEREKKTICLYADGTVALKGNLGKGKTAVELPIKERTTEISKVKWSKINGLEPLEERGWAGKYIPIVRVVGNEWEVEGKQVVSGIVRNAKDAQRMFNYWTSQEAEFLALAPKAPFIGAVGQFETMDLEWGNANTEPYSRLEYDPIDVNGIVIPPPQRAQPPMPSAGLIQAKLGAADDLQSAVGQYNPSLGAEAKEKSGKAILARQKQADVGTFHYIDNQGRAIRHTGRIVLDLIPKIYDTKRVARILGEDGEPDHVTIDPDQQAPMMEMQGQDGAIEKIYNPSIGQYDVRVTVGPSYTTKRQEAAEFMAQVLQGNKELMSVMGDLYFKMLDVPGAEEISERLKKTLPPQLQKDDDDEQEQMIDTPEGPLPVSQAGQAIATLSQQVQEMGMAMEKAKTQDVANKAAELDIRKDELKIKLYEAETNRMKVMGGQSVDEQELELKGTEITLEHQREVHALNQAGEIHENENALRQHESAAKAAEKTEGVPA